MTTIDLQAALAAHRNGNDPMEPVTDGLVSDVCSALRDYVVMTPEQTLVVALWVIHTYVVDSLYQTPYLAVTSPEKQCGKSRLLETLEVLVHAPWSCVLPSEPVFFRTIEAAQPTVLLDEVDAIFSPKSAPLHEGLRAAINAGHRRGASIPRCVGPQHELRAFAVYCAKVLAGIGALPDTIADRSISIRLERKTRAERVKQFRRRDVEPQLEPLRQELAEWAGKHAEVIGDARPEMPDELSDRMQEGCESLVAIADLLDCGIQARAALVKLFSGERVDSHESLRLQLLRDIRDVFSNPEKPYVNEPAGIHTTQLLSELKALEESPWKTYYGHREGLDARDLASLLREYGIRSQSIRSRSMQTTAKGYKRDSFAAAWSRYL
jgi:Protein of unknown function (DUF3631)